jgi:hypothetical protein
MRSGAGHPARAADSANYRIRRIEAAAPHTITTVAGTGAFGYSGDGGPAASAQISYVQGIELDGGGNLFIADRNNNRVRRVDRASGTITTIAGNGTSCLVDPCLVGDGGPAMAAIIDGPEDVAFDGAGNLYIADLANRRVRRVESVGPPTAVRVAGFSARRVRSGVLLRWKVVADGVVGFRLFRGNGRERLPVGKLLPGRVQGGMGYSWVDGKAPRTRLSYWLQAIGPSKSTTWHGPVLVRARR